MAATGGRDYGERTPPGGAAEAGAAATAGLDDGEGATPGGAADGAEAGAWGLGLCVRA